MFALAKRQFISAAQVENIANIEWRQAIVAANSEVGEIGCAITLAAATIEQINGIGAGRERTGNRLLPGCSVSFCQVHRLAGHDADLALLAGDYLYALGLARLAALGDHRAVGILADLISRCAQLHAEGAGASVPDMWKAAAREIAGSTTPEGSGLS